MKQHTQQPSFSVCVRSHTCACFCVYGYVLPQRSQHHRTPPLTKAALQSCEGRRHAQLSFSAYGASPSTFIILWHRTHLLQAGGCSPMSQKKLRLREAEGAPSGHTPRHGGPDGNAVALIRHLCCSAGLHSISDSSTPGFQRVSRP